MKKPPTAVTQLIIERIRTITPHILALVGLEYSMKPPTTMIIPIMKPKIASANTVLLAEAAPVTLNEPIIDPTKARAPPQTIANNPPTRDKTIAAVGLAPISDQ